VGCCQWASHLILVLWSIPVCFELSFSLLGHSWVWLAPTWLWPCLVVPPSPCSSHPAYFPLANATNGCTSCMCDTFCQFVCAHCHGLLPSCIVTLLFVGLALSIVLLLPLPLICLSAVCPPPVSDHCTHAARSLICLFLNQFGLLLV
jgi:hypothetical protein